MMPLERPGGRAGRRSCVVDATSARRRAALVDPTELDVYYFAPQKCFAADGGLWLARVLAGRRRAHRAHRTRRAAGSRRRSTSRIALENCRLDQTYNTPALATLFLLDQQLEWMLRQRRAGLGARPVRPLGRRSSTAGPRPADCATPFVAEPGRCARVVGTIDLDASIDAATRGRRCCGPTAIVDTESYRKLGRNQLRIAMFPAIEPDDVDALTRCIDSSSPPWLGCAAIAGAGPRRRAVVHPARAAPLHRAATTPGATSGHARCRSWPSLYVACGLNASTSALEYPARNVVAAVVARRARWRVVVTNLLRAQRPFSWPRKIGPWRARRVRRRARAAVAGCWATGPRRCPHVRARLVLLAIYVVTSYGLIPMTRWAVCQLVEQLATSAACVTGRSRCCCCS